MGISNTNIDHLELLGVQRWVIRQSSPEKPVEFSEKTGHPSAQTDSELSKISLIACGKILSICIHDTNELKGLRLIQDIAQTFTQISPTPQVFLTEQSINLTADKLIQQIKKIKQNQMIEHLINFGADKVTISQQEISTTHYVKTTSLTALIQRPALKRDLWQSLSACHQSHVKAF